LQQLERTRIVEAHLERSRTRSAFDRACARDHSRCWLERAHELLRVVRVGLRDKGSPLPFTQVCWHRARDAGSASRNEGTPALLTPLAAFRAILLRREQGCWHASWTFAAAAPSWVHTRRRRRLTLRFNRIDQVRPIVRRRARGSHRALSKRTCPKVKLLLTIKELIAHF